MKPNFTNAFFQKTRCLRTVLRRAVVCMLLLGTTVVHAQERKITVDTRQEVTLVQFFRQVEASSDYLFNYKDQDVADIRVSVKVADASIQEVMDLALARTSLTYTVKGRHVIIGQSAARSAGTPPRTDSRPVALTGRVTDEKGMPFVGVTVIQEGTTNGCVTDADGNYRISVPVGASVSFSYIGYKTQRTHVGVQTRVDIRLEPSDISLETVVVTALGIKKAEKSLGYSLQQVNSDAFDKVKTDNPINALNGKVAGLTVNTRAGILEDPPIKLRGETPIYVINGTPVTYYRGVSSDDIESITVLKGPQAAVLYGSRGANGAILITTKTGDDIGEKTEITLNSSTMFTAGYLTLPEQQSIYGTGDFGQYSYLDGKGGGVYDGLWTWGPKLDQKDPTTPSGYFETVQYNSPIDPKTGKRIPTPFVSHKDNFRNFLQQGLTTSNNVSISHKFKEGSFRISLNQLYRRGQTPNTDLKRFGVNMAANYNITRKLHINASMIYNYTYSKNRPWSGYGNSHPYYNILVYMGANNDIRDLRNYWEEGQEGYAQRNWNHVWFNNPWFVAEEYTRPYSEPELIASASLDYDITDDLNFMVKAATDSKHQNQEECKPYAWVGNDRGLYSVGSDRRVDVNLDAMLSYKKRFGEFDLDAMLGVSLFNYQRNYLFSTTEGGLQQPDLYNLSNSQNTPSTTSKIERRRMAGAYGSVTLGYRDAFYLSFTGRNDWSSTLNKNNRSFFYPSVAFSALIAEAVKLPKAVSFWKVRASWAKVGFDQSTVYMLQDTYSFNTYWDGNAAFTPPTTIIDPNIKPYFTSSFEVGTDLRFFGSRLRFDFSYYRTYDEGQIQKVDINQSSGYEEMLTNGNDYRREGYELMVGATPIKTKDWKWDISFNWFQTRKYLDKIYNGAYNYNNLKVGDRADALYESVWQRDPQGNFIVFENNGRPIEDPFKRVIGYAGADWEFGISSTLRYRNWSLSFDIAGRVGGVIRSDLNARMIEAGTHKLTAAPERELDWTKTPSYIPSNAVVVVDGDIEYDDHGNVLYDTRGYAPSTTPVYFKSWIGYMGKLNGPYTMGYNLFKGDFIKLRTMSVGYDFSDLLSGSRIFKGLELSVIGTNLLIWKKLDNEDPDAAYKNFSYPTERMIGFNLTLKL